LQALGAGAPTLALDTAFNREVIPDDFQLVPPVAEEIAAKIRLMIGDEELRHQLQALGRQTISDRYTWNDVCDRYGSLLELVAAGPAGFQNPPQTESRRLDGTQDAGSSREHAS
jgi:glycosyltransferase involved in cell wall biosynthesis